MTVDFTFLTVSKKVQKIFLSLRMTSNWHFRFQVKTKLKIFEKNMDAALLKVKINSNRFSQKIFSSSSLIGLEHSSFFSHFWHSPSSLSISSNSIYFTFFSKKILTFMRKKKKNFHSHSISYLNEKGRVNMMKQRVKIRFLNLFEVWYHRELEKVICKLTKRFKL